MEASKTPKRWTYEEFARLPGPPGARFELIAGDLVVTPSSPTPPHQIVVSELLGILREFVRANDLGLVLTGPIDCLLGEGDYLVPDLVFLANTHLSYLTKRGIEGPPDLVIEVLSPSTAARDRGIKLERYRLLRVREYWLVDPAARTLEVCRLEDEPGRSVRLGTTETYSWRPVLGGAVLDLSVASIFATLP